MSGPAAPVPGASEALDALRPGRTCVYHVGDLATDALAPGPVQDARDKAARLAERGLVLLTQRRVGQVGEGRWAYLATGRRRADG